MRMKKIYALAVTLCLLAAGCVFISLPGVEPLSEKAVGGKGRDKVVLMDISGLIADSERDSTLGIETGVNITARVREELTLAAKDPDVKALVVRINSPGGSVTTCDIINHEIRQFKLARKLPVVAELMDVAASGGYYVAVAADRIIAHPTTVTGSIGVIAYSVSAAGLMDKIGVHDQTIKSGDKKDMGSPLKRMTPEEQRIFQSVIDGMHERFINVVAEGRKGAGLSRDDVRKAADGRVYTAEQALGLKLIDEVGYLDDAVAAAKKGAGIREATVITYAPMRSYRNNIYSAAFSRQAPGISLVNIDAGSLLRPGMRFMYLWMP